MQLSSRIGALALSLLTLLPGAAARAGAAAAGIPSSDCMECHSDHSLSTTNGGKTVSLFVATNVLAKSIHGGLSCTDCHSSIKDLPHDEKRLPAVSCAECHEQEGKEYARSIHGLSGAMGASAAARCTDCHGRHDVLSPKDPQSPVFKLNLPRTCAACHSSSAITREYRMGEGQAAHYMESIHGRALIDMGLIVVPTCNDCHGVHDIRRSVDRDSPISHANVGQTCGKCHVGVQAIYDRSVHGQLLAKGDPRGPNCVDCHSAHEIESPTTGHFKASSDKRCGRCHEDRLRRYRETYHGKAMALGRPHTAPDVAACHDCHGHHDVVPAADPASRLSSANILPTCQRCHPKATAKFTEYMPHADPLDGKNYPLLHGVFVFMTALLIGVFLFFGLHTGFWMFRMAYLFVTDSRRFREVKVEAQSGDEWFVRFPPFHRFLHLLVVTSFLLLVITGIPLKFFEARWAHVIFRLLGGADVARVLHHFGAIITFLYFVLHLTELTRKAWRGRVSVRDPETGRWSFRRLIGVLFGPDTLLPNLQDWRDFVAHQKWFFRKGPRPQFDRWTYWEKFDYLAVFWGVAMIGVSGLVMWFPEFTTRYLPGWIINIALIIHSDEALLAAGFIFSFHFFNTHFRPDKFPMDTVIFSGRVSKAEMLHERQRWYDRLVEARRLDENRVRDEWERSKPIARSLGFLFFGVGVILLVLIVYAMSIRLSNGGH